LDGGDERIGFVADAAQVIDGRLELRNIDVQRLDGLVGAEMDGTVLNDRAVNFEGEKVFDDLKSGAASTRLRFLLVGGVHEVKLGLIHQHATNHPALAKGLPFEGKIDPLGHEKRDGHIAGPLVDAHVFDGVSAAPEMDMHFANVAFIERIAVERSIDVVPYRPRKEGAYDPENQGEHEQDNSQPAPDPVSFAPWGPLVWAWARTSLVARISFAARALHRMSSIRICFAALRFMGH
jgi:hypothetical protein